MHAAESPAGRHPHRGLPPSTGRRAPHPEDCHYHPVKVAGPSAGEEFQRIQPESCFASIEAGFEVSLASGEKVIPSGHQVQRSIITLQVAPDNVEIVENTYKPGSIRLHFTDSTGRRYRFFPITDLGFYDYAQRHRESSALDSLNQQIAAQKEIFLRIGLSRNYKNPQGKEGFWLQANGIYTFPSVLRYIRSYPAAESNDS
jgi:hypothetical protein